jgi:hypothetical protein
MELTEQLLQPDWNVAITKVQKQSIVAHHLVYHILLVKIQGKKP